MGCRCGATFALRTFFANLDVARADNDEERLAPAKAPPQAPGRAVGSARGSAIVVVPEECGSSAGETYSRSEQARLLIPLTLLSHCSGH
uniref:Secreted protein n=1 Tax=Mycena chlorophos TaxID=658473 RepID=A0ABQ0L426_MYCCL|nr:predicted protein [Mycena chlorophos]